MPTSSADLVDFFLMTETGDMEYFVAKARPQLTRDFFAVLDSRIGQLRFAQEAEREGLDELVGLREYVTQFLKAQVRRVERAGATGMGVMRGRRREAGPVELGS